MKRLLLTTGPAIRGIIFFNEYHFFILKHTQGPDTLFSSPNELFSGDFSALIFLLIYDLPYNIHLHRSHEPRNAPGTQ
jgi:hypothetical protein